MPETETEYQWSNKAVGAFSKTSDEAFGNAMMTWGVLHKKGWTLNAVCGVLGNIHSESGYNPWRWEGDDVRSTSNYNSPRKGYGLPQFTETNIHNSVKYIDDPRAKKLYGFGPNFTDREGSQNDGTAQLLFIDAYADYYINSKYGHNVTYEEYKVSEADSGYLAVVWLSNYERPAEEQYWATMSTRRENAQYWYNRLNGLEPPDVPIGGDTKRKLPLWMWIRKELH